MAKTGARTERWPDDDAGGLLRNLVHATYWLDDGLQAYMREHAGLSLPRAQSMAMVYLTEGVDRPSDLAVKLAVSKQAAQQVLKELRSKGIIEVTPDPDNGRQKRVQLTPRGRELRLIAQQGLSRLQQVLAQRIGATDVARLQQVLAQDWGDAPPSG